MISNLNCEKLIFAFRFEDKLQSKAKNSVEMVMFSGHQLNSWYETWALESQLLLTVMESVSTADPFLKKSLGMVCKGVEDVFLPLTEDMGV